MGAELDRFSLMRPQIHDRLLRLRSARWRQAALQ
jgi:hypothetical protein